MKTLISAFILSCILLLQGCVPAPSNARKSSLSQASTSNTNKAGTNVYPTFASDESMYWYTTSKIAGTVTINKNSQDIVYLRGKLVHDFLSAKDISGTEYFRKQYCMVGNFSSSSYKQLRVRAVPIYVTTSSKAIERLLRIDIPSASDNATLCNKTDINAITPSNAAYSLSQISSASSGQITTSNLNFYEVSASGLVLIEPLLVKFTSVFLKVDLTSNSTESTSSCTNSSCSAKGFDCCIAGQCVKDASEKASASSDPQYAQAKLDYAANPLSFINYPNIFYICTNIAHTPPATTTPSTSTPQSEAMARVAQYLADYTCTADVAAGLGFNNCGTGKNEAAYIAIKKKLAIACGCNATDDQMAFKCPDWGVVPVYPAGALKTNANITDFKCYTPVPENPIGPITNLNVSVPNRSAPHRFYSTTGVNFDDISGLLTKSPGTLQEGDDFTYTDEYNKYGPNNGRYNANSVLGRMTIDLNHTLPAKMVNVELGKTYILTATNGYFTPCTQCAKDSWFDSFTAYPSSQRGVGLQASGYTTSRNSYSSNSTFGNYEDTKFGRACYVPMTMLGLSHQKNTSLITQRQNRLETQAAFYINGYQRDWYGFNKGALIGSFDGVKWFAVGTGRRATATSSKLYLAINAAFLDLADRTDTIVNIIPDFAANTASDYDYDPELALTDPRQNSGATCQKFHQCSTDADCITQLGWEYSCAEVSQLKTKWPIFTSDAVEIANQEKVGSLFEILQDTISTSNSKRCVYRGAGAPCKADLKSGLNEYTQKGLTCAPNFYCASISSAKFNDQLVRSPNELDNIRFGMDTNILGRPLNYVTANQSLPLEVMNNINMNALDALKIASGEMGICRPGKALTANEVTNHMTADANKRTDYISQIAGCNSTAVNTNRFITCPALDNELNYVNPLETDSAILSETKIHRGTQNSCGGEAKHTSTLLSAFLSIEGLSLINAQNIDQPTLVQDACLRRAGAVCHTDLDCGPNKMHEDLVGNIDIKYFGETEAEQNYWRESLICGQGITPPGPGTSGYLTYQMNANRCCREIGKDFTMHTEGPKALVPENVGSNELLKTARFPYYNVDPDKDGNYNVDTFDTKGPAAKYRYSRYTVSKIANDHYNRIPKVTTTKEPAPNQWQVVNETASSTCCGGGWIRKFADGTHDWKVKHRLTIDSSNFSCLNFRSPLADPTFNNFGEVIAASYQREFEFFCKTPSLDGGACLQVPFQTNLNFSIYAPKSYEPADAVAEDENLPAGIPASRHTILDTSPISETGDLSDGKWTQSKNPDVPYMPSAFYYAQGQDQIKNASHPFFTDKSLDYGVAMYMPAYMGWDGTSKNSAYIKSVYIKYFHDEEEDPPSVTIKDITNNQPLTTEECEKALIDNTTDQPVDQIAGKEKWCITTDTKTKRPVIVVKADNDPGASWKYAGIVIEFKPIEQKNSTTVVATPGNALYYTSKLARLELIGIPQITYEPLYCNNNQNNLVQGIFKSDLKTRSQFQTAAVSSPYSSDPNNRYKTVDSNSVISEESGYGNFEKKFTYQDKLDHQAVFSSKDFACCTPLGKTPAAADKCCSGYAVTSTDGKTTTCKLPKGTDLNVYFNKFVSSEGVGADQPSAGLIVTGTEEEIDFNPYTGEPKYRHSTFDKLVALGARYCDGGKVVTGGAFGAFPPEPFSGSYDDTQGGTGSLWDTFAISIVDSTLDYIESDPTLGKIPFDAGYRWNYHYYCK